MSDQQLLERITINSKVMGESLLSKERASSCGNGQLRAITGSNVLRLRSAGPVRRAIKSSDDDIDLSEMPFGGVNDDARIQRGD